MTKTFRMQDIIPTLDNTTKNENQLFTTITDFIPRHIATTTSIPIIPLNRAGKNVDHFSPKHIPP